MAGMTFFYTADMVAIDAFYGQKLGAQLWLDQGSCHIYRKDDFLFGFCPREKAVTTDQILTFFYPERSQVDQQYRAYRDLALAEPLYNERFNIYHFFIKDPEGRLVEFQHFEADIDWDF
ncbi:MAG: VOC family protein [Spirochaetes bacterium]|nr:VOC family protein [Spirochaetota bacterium]